MKVSWKKNVSLFLAGQCLTMFGSMLVHYAILWHVTLQTQSSVALTLLSVAGALPMFFISPFGGVWADKYNRKHLINIADGSIAVVTLIMALLFSAGLDNIWMLLVCSVVRSLGQGVQSPAVSALIPQLVEEEHLTKVNGIQSTVQSLTMFAAPMAGGALLAFAPVQYLLFIDVATAAIGISILYFFVRVPVQEKKEGDEVQAKSHWHDLKEGLRYVWNHGFIRKFFVFSAVFYVMVAPVAMLTPLQVARNFGPDIWLLGGFSFTAEHRLAAIEIAFSVGMMLGGLLIGIWGGFKNKSQSVILSIFLFGAFTVALGMMGNFWIYLAFMMLIGSAMPLFNAPMMSIFQTKVDPAYMGRVFSVMAMISSVMMPMGMVIFGPIGDKISIDWLLIGTGAAMVLMGFAFIMSRELRLAGKPE